MIEIPHDFLFVFLHYTTRIPNILVYMALVYKVHIRSCRIHITNRALRPWLGQLKAKLRPAPSNVVVIVAMQYLPRGSNVVPFWL